MVFEYHGWISLRSTATAVEDEPPLRLDEIRAAETEVSGYALMDLQAMNGEHFLHMGGKPNHAGAWGIKVIELFHRIGGLAPGSYGLLHVHDDEDEFATDFRVYRMVRGTVTEHIEPLLSPVIPTLEDPYL